MHGIYLHIAADAGGSLAVILSTTLTLWKPWFLWDPLATILIAVLIFAAAVPLVVTSARKLLLVIPDEMEWGVKNALQELTTVPGVVGYSVPKFWLEDREGDGHGHDHGHNHGHKHEHEHDHAHDHAHDHTHSHASHEHDRSNSHHTNAVHSRHHSDASHASHTDAHSERPKILGIVHIFISRAASPDAVRERATAFFAERNMDIVVQIERDGDGRCWCGGRP